MVQTVGALSNRWHIMMANTAVGPIVGGAAADIGLSYPAPAARAGPSSAQNTVDALNAAGCHVVPNKVGAGSLDTLAVTSLRKGAPVAEINELHRKGAQVNILIHTGLRPSPVLSSPMLAGGGPHRRHRLEPGRTTQMVPAGPRFAVDRGRAHGMVRVSRVHGDPRRILAVEPDISWRSTGHRAGLVGVAVK